MSEPADRSMPMRANHPTQAKNARAVDAASPMLNQRKCIGAERLRRNPPTQKTHAVRVKGPASKTTSECMSG